jgi:hypothetical protein
MIPGLGGIWLAAGSRPVGGFAGGYPAAHGDRQLPVKDGRAAGHRLRVDLGELTEGHHVVARGIMLGRAVRVPRFDPDQVRQLMSGGSGPGGGFPVPGQGLRPESWEERCTGAELHYELAGRAPSRPSRTTAPCRRTARADSLSQNA